MRTAWKHGVMGIDDADSKKTQCFYSEVRDQKVARQQSKDFINTRRTECKSSKCFLKLNLGMALGMGTSDQVQIGGPDYKRSESLHHQGVKDSVVFIHRDWKAKHSVPLDINPPRTETTKARIFEPASNVDRKKQEGCMAKIKIERATKLDKEDVRGRSFNILTGATTDKKVWVNAMGDQQKLIC